MLSAIVFIIPIVLYSVGSRPDSIWIAVFVAQLGLSFLWSIIKFGAFSTSGYGTRRIGAAFMNAKHNKLGGYDENVNPKKIASPLEKLKEDRIWIGVVVMILIAVVELIPMFAVMYA